MVVWLVTGEGVGAGAGWVVGAPVCTGGASTVGCAAAAVVDARPLLRLTASSMGWKAARSSALLMSSAFFSTFLRTKPLFAEMVSVSSVSLSASQLCNIASVEGASPSSASMSTTSSHRIWASDS